MVRRKLKRLRGILDEREEHKREMDEMVATAKANAPKLKCPHKQEQCEYPRCIRQDAACQMAIVDKVAKL